jgi:hypothetical protein
MFHIKRNIPAWERLARLLLAIVVAAVAYSLTLPGMLGLVAYLSAVTLAGTSIIGFCPACALVGRKLEGGQS